MRFGAGRSSPASILLVVFVASLLGLAVAAAQEGEVDEEVVFSDRERQRILRLSPLEAPALDATNRFDGDPRAERLGRFLFFDEALSANGEISCATCHDPRTELTDTEPVAKGLGVGARRTPSLWNVASQRWFFHDGSADSLWSQALRPLENPLELGGSRTAVAHRIAREPALRAAFEELRGPLPELEDGQRFPARAHPDPRRPDSAHARAWAAMAPADREAINRLFSDVGKVIAAYERGFVSRDAPFDRFVEGLREDDAVKRESLGAAARRGLKLFLGKGRCRLCHNGPAFTDGEFHGLGLAARGGGMPTDPGRYAGVPALLADPFNAAGRFSDAPEGERAARLEGMVAGPANWGEFKTPSLRNVARRPPFMHGGQFDDLAAVLHFYSTLEGAAPLHQHQEQVLTAREFTEDERTDLAAFLESLTGAPPAPELLAPPSLEELAEPLESVPKRHK